MGGDMDGMGELDAPMPPMGAEDNGMEDPNAMGGEDPMAGGDPSAMGEDPNAMGGEDDELMNIINGLSIEDKAAVTKYAKSMADDSNGEMPQNDDAMPMESKKSLKSIIDETINDVLDDNEGITRPENRLPKAYRNVETPFKSPF